VGVALGAAELLARRGISCSVINARFVKPLDVDGIITAAEGHELVATVEENALVGGFGSAVTEVLADGGVSAQLLRFGVPDRFVTHGSVPQLLSDVGLTVPNIADIVEGRLSPAAHEKGAS
jgi:1-deoxy-D-xylulose-5-phosphate synthase